MEFFRSYCNWSSKSTDHCSPTYMLIVIYWPMTKPSIKRCTCVNKQKNSRSRWALDNNITRCPGGLSQLESRCQSESQRQTEGFGPSVTQGWATPAKMRKKYCYGRRWTWGQYSSLSPFRELSVRDYTFIKKCVRLFIEVIIIVDYVSSYICICMRLYNRFLKASNPPMFSPINYFNFIP